MRLKLSCPWGVGQWRGDWSAGSRLWARYPSADAELRQREATEYADAEDGEGREDRAALAGESSVFQSFWMSVEDFATEFSQARRKGERRRGVRGIRCFGLALPCKLPFEWA